MNGRTTNVKPRKTRYLLGYLEGSGFSMTDPPDSLRSGQRHYVLKKSFSGVVMKTITIPSDEEADTDPLTGNVEKLTVYDDAAFEKLIRELEIVLRESRKPILRGSFEPPISSKSRNHGRPHPYGNQRRMYLPEGQDLPGYAAMNTWQSKYHEFIDFAWPGGNTGARVYNFDGCDTKQQSNRFFRFILAFESLGPVHQSWRREKYDLTYRIRLRARYKSLKDAISRINSAIRDYKRKCRVRDTSEIPASAIRTIAKASRVRMDIPLVKKVLAQKATKNIIEDRLSGELKIPKSQMWDLVYRRTPKRPARPEI